MYASTGRSLTCNTPVWKPYSGSLTGFSLLAIDVECGNFPFSFYFLTLKSSMHKMNNHPFREVRCKQGKLHTEGSNPKKMEKEECIKVSGSSYLWDIWGNTKLHVATESRWKDMVEGEKWSRDALFSSCRFWKVQQSLLSANSKALQMYSPCSFTDHVRAILRGIKREEMADYGAGGFFKGYFRSQLKKTKAI